MKKLIAIFALTATLVGCDKQHNGSGLDITIDGAIETPICVSIDETRAAGVDSAEGIFEHGILDSDDITMRYILQIYINGQIATRYVEYSDTKSVEFLPTLIPGHDYKFVVWADVVTKDSAATTFSDVDNHYNTADLSNITLKGDWVPMDETRDAFTGYAVENDFVGDHNVTVTLTRPFAKLRIVATDKAKANTTPVRGIVKYISDFSVGFDAVAGSAKELTSSAKVHEYTLDTYSEDTNESYTLFTDYIFANDNDISLTFAFYEEGASYPIMNKTYAADNVSIKCNCLTTIKGEVLTGGEVIVVTAAIESGYYGYDGVGVEVD
ncbi:MAG: hypothetical protein IJN51_05725 [Alistipes sp.]|nr:hypothetical protein [Alistipes sp.]